MKKTFLTISLFGFFLLMLFSTNHLHAQQRYSSDQWVGLHNMYYQNTDNSRVDTNALQTRVTTQIDKEKALSFGVHYRTINENKVYQQIDIFSLDLAVVEDLLVAETIGQTIFEPTRGAEVKTTNVRLGYQRGKMFPLVNRMTADVGVGGYPTYIRKERTPFTSVGFPVRETWLGLGLNIHLGLNYQIHENINIGYSFIPVSAQWFRYEERVENPILTERQQTNSEARLETSVFDSVLDFRNVRISYVIEGGEKKNRRRRR